MVIVLIQATEKLARFFLSLSLQPVIISSDYCLNERDKQECGKVSNMSFCLDSVGSMIEIMHLQLLSVAVGM